eukprot:TRINITY_DN6390_c0_g1_i4.p1 TRINITY_DN6390_c0_g1~~TRINITY_DN6390_c0_g1_i4.p1  ORF type:complete len:114 (+),score=8.63 TRINITY_DN6390_c0_g1_i4:155-496(+)
MCIRDRYPCRPRSSNFSGPGTAAAAVLAAHWEEMLSCAKSCELRRSFLCKSVAIMSVKKSRFMLPSGDVWTNSSILSCGVSSATNRRASSFASLSTIVSRGGSPASRSTRAQG